MKQFSNIFAPEVFLHLILPSMTSTLSHQIASPACSRLLVNGTPVLLGPGRCQPQRMQRDWFYGSPDNPVPLRGTHSPGLPSS